MRVYAVADYGLLNYPRYERLREAENPKTFTAPVPQSLTRLYGMRDQV